MKRALITLFALAGCAQTPLATVTPVQTPAAARTGEGDYASAKAAIARRDYEAALAYLQAAAERDPKDARVPNALGVVYDLTGRFELSAQAYAKAQALDPSLASVAQNIAYSRQLQAAVLAPAPAAPDPTAAPLTAPRLVATAGDRLRLELPPAPEAPSPSPATPPASSSPPAGLAPGLTGHPLLVSNASGRAGADALVRSALAARGWTARIDAAAETAPTTRILYPAAFADIAQALARTLPGPAQLAPCQDGCDGLRLLLGRDAASWKLSAYARSGS